MKRKNRKSNKFPIPLGKLREGAELCLKNAQRLYHGSVSSATSDLYAIRLSLLVLSFEESAKGLMIQEKLDKKEAITEDDWQKWTRRSPHIRRLRHINEKLKEAFGVDFFEPFSEREINRLKQFGLYVDWKDNREWSVFFEKLDQKTANLLYQRFLNIAERAIELLKDNLFKCKVVVDHIEKDEDEGRMKKRLRKSGYV